MAGTYAHYSFGIQIFDEIENHITPIIATNLDLFLLGLHGTDIFYFYKPLQSNKINQIAYNTFPKPRDEFFINAKQIILNSKERDKELAYILGFICHFILNIQCSDYFNEEHFKTETTIKEIECEFDKYLLTKNRKNPWKVNFINHLSTDIETIECICPFFNLEKEYIKSSIEYMKNITYLYTKSNKLIRFLALRFLNFSGNRHKLQEIFFYSQTNNKRIKECEQLYRVYNTSVNEAIYAIKNFYNFLHDEEPLNHIFL